MSLLSPADRTARGLALQAEITARPAPQASTPLEESWRDFVFAEVWNREGLDRRARYLISIAGALMAGTAAETLEAYITGALKGGELSLAELREGALHMAVYGGWGRGQELDRAITRVAQALALPAADCPPLCPEPWEPAERIARGEAEFANVMTFPGGPPMTPYMEAISNFVFGEMWCRPGLDQRSRRWMTLVGVADSSSETPIKSHIHAAMASGNCSPAEMHEFVLQYGIHAGWPKASVILSAVFEMAKKVAEGRAWNG